MMPEEPQQARLGKAGVGSYRKEEWATLRSVSTDADELEETWEEWWAHASRSFAQLEKEGIPVVWIDVEVPKLLAWCKAHGRDVNGDSRAEYIAYLTKALHGPRKAGN